MATNFVFRANVNVDNETDRQEAYNRVLPQLSALLPEEIIQLNADVPSVVATVLGALPEILAQRTEAAKLADFDLAHLDQLEDCVLALSHTHLQCVGTAQPTDDLVQLNLEATGICGRFHSDVSNLCLRELIDKSSLRGYHGTPGYTSVAADVLLLVSVLRRHWTTIQGKCACSMEEIDRAEKLATRMLRLVGLREQAPAVSAAWADSRTRAFTLLIRHYDAARRAVSYLRWHQGDADAIAPSLYAGRKPNAAKPEGNTAPTEPVVPAVPVTPNSPAASGQPAPGGNGAGSVTRGPTNPAMPGGSPFMQ